RVEIAPAVVGLIRRQSSLPPDAEIQGQAAADAPVVLRVAGVVWPLLRDVPDGVDAAVGGPSEQERGERVAAGGGEVGVARDARAEIAEVGAAGDVLAAEAVVPRVLVHAAELECVASFDPGYVVVERHDVVLGPVVGRSAPAV